jgi:hypothetical protein
VPVLHDSVRNNLWSPAYGSIDIRRAAEFLQAHPTLLPGGRIEHTDSGQAITFETGNDLGPKHNSLGIAAHGPRNFPQPQQFGLVLRLVQQRRTRLPVFEQTLREVVSVLEGLADQDRDRWLELLSYIAAWIYNEREVPEREALIEGVADSMPIPLRKPEYHHGFQSGRDSGKRTARPAEYGKLRHPPSRCPCVKAPGSVCGRACRREAPAGPAPREFLADSLAVLEHPHRQAMV